MKRLRIVVVAGLLILSSCSGDGDGVSSTTTPVPPSAESTTATTNTTAPTTTLLPTTAPTTPPGVPGTLPPMLLADADGIRMLGDGGWGSIILEGEPVALAVPDLRQGVVFQAPQNEISGLHWDQDLGRNVFEWSGGGPVPIWRIAGPDHAPEAIVTHPDARLTLVDVVEIGGRPNVLYLMYIGGPQSEPAWEQVLEWLYVYDLIGGETQALGLVGSYESSHTRMRFGGDLVAVSSDSYVDAGGTDVWFIPLARLGEQVEYCWLPSLVSERLTYGPGALCTPELGCEGWATVTAASDGSRVAWVQGGRDWDNAGNVTPWPLEVVTVDRATGVETMRRPIGPPSLPAAEPGERAEFIDDDGSFIVISGIGTDNDVVLISPDGEAVFLGVSGATASFWQVSPSTVTDPVATDPPIELRGDGLGLVDFGTKTEDALATLEPTLGPPSRSSEDFYRYYYWDNLSLSLSFDEYPFYRNDGAEHLVAWGHWEGMTSPLHTSRGIGLGATYAELVAAHGDQVTVPVYDDECAPEWYVWLNKPAAEKALRIRVVFDAAPENGGRVIYMHAGAGEGC